MTNRERHRGKRLHEMTEREEEENEEGKDDDCPSAADSCTVKPSALTYNITKSFVSLLRCTFEITKKH